MNITVLFIHALKNGINLDKILACKKYVLKVKVQSMRQKNCERKREKGGGGKDWSDGHFLSFFIILKSH